MKGKPRGLIRPLLMAVMAAAILTPSVGRPEMPLSPGNIAATDAPTDRLSPRELAKLKAASRRGDASAAFRLAILRILGAVAPRNDAEAVRLMRTAAKRGHVRAMYYLGTFYYHGTGIPENKREAATWIGKAARGGDAEAQYVMGMLHLSGEGVAADRDKAIHWLGKAAGQGNEQARETLRELVSYRGRPFGTPLEATLADPLAPTAEKQADTAAVRVEGKGLILDRGEFSLKLSLPDLNEAAPTTGLSTMEALRARLQGGRVEIIFRPGVGPAP